MRLRCVKRPVQLKGAWVLTLKDNGTFTVNWKGKIVSGGRYTATPTTITFGRESGSGCNGSGTYAWKKTATTMRFVRKREAPSCDGRAAVLAHPFTVR